MDPAGFLAFVVELHNEVDPAGFLAFVVERRKEVDALRAELPAALQRCIDPARFAMDAVSEVIPVDRRAVRSPSDLASACVLILEAVVPALADPDPKIGAARPMVPQAARDRARGMAAKWKEAAERKGGVEGAKPPDGHAFLQHVSTFAVAEKEDRELYKRIVLTFSWRRQMPRLALTLGLEDDMEDIIEELITKGQQLDAVNFAYEAGHLEKFSPVPLLKTYLEDSKKIYCAPDNLSTGSGQSGLYQFTSPLPFSEGKGREGKRRGFQMMQACKKSGDLQAAHPEGLPWNPWVPCSAAAESDLISDGLFKYLMVILIETQPAFFIS